MKPAQRKHISVVHFFQSPRATRPADKRIRIRSELSTHWGQFIVGLLLALVSTAATLAVPFCVKVIITGFTEDRPTPTPVLWMCLAVVVGSVSQAASGFMLTRTGELIVFKLRSRMIAHSLRLPLSTVTREGAGTVSSRITYDVSQLRHITDVAAQIPLATLTLLSILAMMIWIDWLLTLVTLASMAAAFGVITAVLNRVKLNFSGQQAAVGGLNHRVMSNLESLSTIKAFQAETLVSYTLDTDAAELRALSLKGARLEALIPTVIALGNQVAMVVVILVGGARMASGNLEIAAFGAFLMYLFQAFSPATALTGAFTKLQEGRAARERCDQLLALPPEADQAAELPAPLPTPGAPSVVFDNVSYTHPGANEATLHDVTFSAPREGLTAIVGASGAGKTTALSLIERFVQPNSGKVTILGHDTSIWPLQALRARIAYVDQAFTLVEATVRENLQLGRTTAAPDAELNAALNAVGLADGIRALPQGLDTLLGRESDLSGGQRQRLALARVLLSDAEIVVLDEPTSQLDGINEHRFRTVIDDLAITRSVIVVAHRLSTVQHAHHVVLMDQGRVVDAADHFALIERCRPYQELVATQIGATSSASTAS
ncbi:ABC transporter ATP-binding protein [Streptomyces sp. BPTC-684]|uniref:ABC transporter ATP-binding protein n=1 Tax=Streptomyces sp. BPTC-684 TaxID=3043734 RepID=UPI0024B269E8|nr:ABC transporter ATP-binding protein [Streptomyces sp. BPTC-684]WHM36808.1 ABC transporter ATP-binding protein [Streptomyces sp. BPTC-684]